MLLDVGCGGDKVEGCLGVDKFPLPGVDIVHDLNVFPWPIESGSVSKVYMRHSLAHLDDVPAVMEELYRICSKGALIHIVTPHFSSDNAFTDPTSKHFFGFRSLNFFCSNVKGFKYRYTDKTFTMVRRKILVIERGFKFSSRSGSRFLLKTVLGFVVVWPELLINSFPRIYERFFAFIFPSGSIYFCLRRE